MPVDRSLAGSPSGLKWLQNFDIADRDLARELLAAVRVVSESEFRSSMKSSLLTYKQRRSKNATFAIRSVKAQAPNSYFTDGVSIPFTGSEYLVRHLLEKSAKATNSVVEPSVELMRAIKPRRILLVGDQAISGNEAVKFADYFWKNPTIKSWHSGRQIEIHVLVHTISQLALDRFSDRTWIDGIHFFETARAISTVGWTPQQQAQFNDLCSRYAHAGARPLGWWNVGSLVLSQHSVGNGLPAILTQTTGPKGRGAWFPLVVADRGFGLRAEDERYTQNFRPTISVERTLEELALAGASKSLSKLERKALKRYSRGDGNRRVLELLVVLRKGAKSQFGAMRALDWTLDEFQKTVSLAQSLGFADAELRVTAIGRRLVRRAAAQVRELKVSKYPRDESDYYPRKLR